MRALDPLPVATPSVPSLAPAHGRPLPASAARVVAEVDAVRDDELAAVNRDIEFVVATVLAAHARITPFLPQFEGMADLDVARVRRLGDYADALLFWNASSSVPPPKVELGVKVARGRVLRLRTIHDLKALVNHGLLPAELLEPFAGQAVHRKVATDLADLAVLVHAHWGAIEGRSLLTLAAVDEAAAFGAEILRVLGEREAADLEFARDRARRNKAYTLVIRTYEDVRSAMTFLRRQQGDADTFAPSLFASGRSPRGRRTSEIDDDD